MMQFEDHAGRREMFVELASALLEAVPKDLLKERIDAAGLVDACGLGQTAASGKSLCKDGDAWLLRRYSYLPDGRHGLAGLLGREAVRFSSPDLLPASADFVIEARLDATSLPAMIQRIAKACGQEADVQNFLDEPLPIGSTLQGMLAKTRLHLIVGIDLASWPVTLSGPRPIDFFVRIEGGQDLLPDLLPQLEKNLGQARAFGTRRGWELPMEGAFLHPQALLLHDQQGIVTFVSSQQYLQQVETAAAKLATAKEFKAATDHFPQAGNLLVYASPRIPVAVAWAIRRQAAGALDANTAPLLAKATQCLAPRPWSLCVACEPDGIATTSELPFAADADLTGALPLLMINSVLFVGARAWKKGSGRAGCILNIRNVQQAIRGYQNMNDLKPGDPIPWGEIFGEDKFLAKPICPDGGSYTFLTKFPDVGALACTCSHADHEPAQHTDW